MRMRMMRDSNILKINILAILKKLEIKLMKVKKRKASRQR
jgi:hypothetical protein